LFRKLNAHSASDRTAAAVIRDVAMGLFAERGAAGVTVREIASAAGVSAGLVMHHFGSKDGLKAALDARAAELVDAMLDDLARLEREGETTSLAELFAGRLEREPALLGYVRRLLLDGGEAADALFLRLFDATVGGMERLVAAQVARPAGDERVRAAFLLANDLATVLLRPRIERAVGIDPLAREGLERWTEAVVDVYTNGIFAGEPGP
jgi:TetR/AcrR family transcriptional regulator, regulator of cefoperazone and chloramphenicol sensitivity